MQKYDPLKRNRTFCPWGILGSDSFDCHFTFLYSNHHGKMLSPLGSAILPSQIQHYLMRTLRASTIHPLAALFSTAGSVAPNQDLPTLPRAAPVHTRYNKWALTFFLATSPTALRLSRHTHTPPNEHTHTHTHPTRKGRGGGRWRKRHDWRK